LGLEASALSDFGLFDCPLASIPMGKSINSGINKHLIVFSRFIIVMDMLTSGFMWSSNWRLLYIANFLCEVLLVAEKMIV